MISTSITTTVLIVGAGPTGLTLAVELARAGVSVRLIDAASGPQPGSRGKGVQSRSLEVFEDLEIIDRVLAHGRLAMPMHVMLSDGTVRRGGAAPAELEGRPDVPYTASLITPEWRVEEALRLRLAELGVAVEFGTALVDFEQSADAVTAEIRHGGLDGAGATVTARWLVGADGGHSVTRKRAGIAFIGETSEDTRMIVADVAVEGIDREAWLTWPAAEGLVSLAPLPSTELFVYQAVLAGGTDPALTIENMQAILEQRSGRRDIRITDSVWSSLWRPNVRLVERYRRGRVFLAGDAAHIHSPAGGQGMNTGIQDAANLGWKLAAVAHGAADSLLDTYEAERRPVAEHVLALSNARFAETVKTNTILAKRDTTTLQLDIGYRESVLARDDRADDAALRAGDRAPDATGLMTVGGERRLFDLTRGGRFTLLCFYDSAPLRPFVGLQALTVLPAGAEPAAGAVVDASGALAHAYVPLKGTLVLIRPDGYIGVISDAVDASAVADYLDAWLPESSRLGRGPRDDARRSTSPQAATPGARSGA